MLASTVACSGGQQGLGLPAGFNQPELGVDASVAPSDMRDIDGGRTTPTAGSTDGGVDEDVDGGAALDPGPPTGCGDRELDDGEDCDGPEPAFRGCSALGYDFGVLTCNSDCTWNEDSCSGTEICTDGKDNDGDGVADCADEDCDSACDDPCAAPQVVAVNSSVLGSTVGWTNSFDASCGDSEGSGAAVAFEVEADADGKLDLVVNTQADLTMSVRTTCRDAASDVVCRWPTRVTLDVERGDRLFVLVAGRSQDDVGEFVLEARLRAQTCGDAIREVVEVVGDDGLPTEECDDGNFIDGDGCNNCRLESTETEPDNDEASGADPFVPGLRTFAQIAPAGDVDYFGVDLTDTSSTLVVSTTNLGDGACALNMQDTVVELLRVDGSDVDVLARDDDGGDGRCSRAVASGLAAGTYHVKVSAADGAYPATFPYRLAVSVGVCGDGAATLGEECDDGNTTAGDGCGATCKEEM